MTGLYRFQAHFVHVVIVAIALFPASDANFHHPRCTDRSESNEWCFPKDFRPLFWWFGVSKPPWPWVCRCWGVLQMRPRDLHRKNGWNGCSWTWGNVDPGDPDGDLKNPVMKNSTPGYRCWWTKILELRVWFMSRQKRPVTPPPIIPYHAHREFSPPNSYSSCGCGRHNLLRKRWSSWSHKVIDTGRFYASVPGWTSWSWDTWMFVDLLKLKKIKTECYFMLFCH